MSLQSVDQLYERYVAPTARVLNKEIDRIDAHIQQFIALSPFVVIASGDAQHHMDASPRGGAPGFVRVLDAHTLLIPDAPGNNRLDTLRNVLQTRQVGLLFFVPGVDESLRINGQAELCDDAAHLAHFAGDVRAPKLVIRVTVQSAYMHCAKAIMRSKLWDPRAQVDRSVLPTMGEMIKDHAQLEGPAETQEAMLKRYEADL